MSFFHMREPGERRCGLAALFAACVLIGFGVCAQSALGADMVYWTNSSSGGRISHVDLTGLNGGVFPTSAPVSVPNGVAFDLAAGRVYWANDGTNTISCASLDGSGDGTLNTGSAIVNSPSGVAIDTATGRIYWANTGAPKISYASLDGSGGGDLQTGAATVGAAEGVAIDPLAGKIYWANRNPAKISFAKLDGSGGGDLPTFAAATAMPEFPALLEAPRGTARPTVGGGHAPRSTLTCSQGLWAQDLPGASDYRAPQTVAYQWSLNGGDIPGATHDSISAQASGDYRCRVIATNVVGSNAQTSDTFDVATSRRLHVNPPVLARVSESHRSWRAANKLARTARKSRPPLGTTFSFTLNEPARVTFAFTQTLGGRRASHRCVTQTGRNRHKPACTRAMARGAIVVSSHAGANRFVFLGRLNSGTRLRPGRYMVSLTAVNGASERSRTSSLRFTIVR